MKRIIPSVLTAGCLIAAAVVQWKRLELQPWQEQMLAQLALVVGLLALVGAAGVMYIIAGINEIIEGWRDG